MWCTWTILKTFSLLPSLWGGGGSLPWNWSLVPKRLGPLVYITWQSIKHVASVSYPLYTAPATLDTLLFLKQSRDVPALMDLHRYIPFAWDTVHKLSMGLNPSPPSIFSLNDTLLIGLCRPLCLNLQVFNPHPWCFWFFFSTALQYLLLQLIQCIDTSQFFIVFFSCHNINSKRAGFCFVHHWILHANKSTWNIVSIQLIF